MVIYSAIGFALDIVSACGARSTVVLDSREFAERIPTKSRVDPPLPGCCAGALVGDQIIPSFFGVSLKAMPAPLLDVALL